jgi:branched-chain amino acid transport system ATP-binding protein
MSAATLTCRDIVAGYVAGMPIVHGVSLNVAPAEIVSIIGPNGAGKSTFLKAVAGLVHVESGSVDLDGDEVRGKRTDQLVSAGIAFVPQTGNIFTTMTIHENLVVGGHTLGRELKGRIERAYAQFPVLAQRRAALGRVLSGGQRQMLAIARGLMTAPKIIMLDEPTAGLSPRVVQEVLADLRRLAKSGVAVLMVEQNARAALAASDRAYVLAQGRNYLDGRAADLLDDPEVSAAFLGGRRARA